MVGCEASCPQIWLVDEGQSPLYTSPDSNKIHVVFFQGKLNYNDSWSRSHILNKIYTNPSTCDQIMNKILSIHPNNTCIQVSILNIKYYILCWNITIYISFKRYIQTIFMIKSQRQSDISLIGQAVNLSTSYQRIIYFLVWF